VISAWNSLSCTPQPSWEPHSFEVSADPPAKERPPVASSCLIYRDLYRSGVLNRLPFRLFQTSLMSPAAQKNFSSNQSNSPVLPSSGRNSTPPTCDFSEASFLIQTYSFHSKPWGPYRCCPTPAVRMSKICHYWLIPYLLPAVLSWHMLESCCCKINKQALEGQTEDFPGFYYCFRWCFACLKIRRASWSL